MDLARDVKGNKKGFCKHIHDKRKIRENVGTLMNGTGVLITQVLRAFFVSIFIRKIDLQGSQASETNENWSKDNILLVKEYHFRE